MAGKSRVAWWLVVCAAGACAGEPDVARLPARVIRDIPFLESGGRVVMEAENATGTAPGTGAAASATWTDRSVTAASGGVAIEATPATLGVNTGDTTIGPRRDYKVRFATAGTYQLWVHARGPTSSDDTFHAGLNGSALTFGGSGLLVPHTWTWINKVGTRRITVTVTGPGLATINIWMREDGIFVDKILLTTDSAFTPSGIAQAESPREETADASPPPADAAPPPPDSMPPPPDSPPPPPDSAPPPADAAPADMAPPADTAPPADSGSPDTAPPPQPLAFSESGGQVVMEAENSTGVAAGTGRAQSAIWTSRAVTSASAGTALEATPNAGVHTADEIIGPRRDYRINFSTPGFYQVWVRMRGPTPSDDTIHVGLNGVPASLGESGLLAPGSWTWVNRVASRRAVVQVGAAGIHTFNIWMREDGVFIDKVVLTTNASFTPSGTGPAESPRAGGVAPGQWSAPVVWPVEGVHGHLLPNGKVLLLSYGDEGNMHVHVWDPASNTFTPAPPGHVNVGCSGHAFMPDGRLLVAGGEPHHDHSGTGIRDVHIFDYRDNSWTMLPEMNDARWYPNVTTLANGEMAVITGDVTPDVGNPIPQVLTAGGTWRTLSTAHRVLPSYSFTHLAPDGRVFVSGPERHSVLLDTTGTGAWSPIVASQTFTRIRSYGSSVMYADGRVLVLGGGDPPTSSAEVINLNDATPRWRTVAPMAFARRQHNATLLPDGRILVSGGSSAAGHNNPSGAVYPAEIWDPASETFSVVAAKSVPGLYHSLAMLLPDGRVLTTPGKGWGPTPHEERREVQFYSPDYLFRGSRPTITSAPTTVSYASSFAVGTPDTDRLRRVTWVRLPSVTHSFDQNQRFVEATWVRATGGIWVQAPSDRRLAPPGHYLMFLWSQEGAPSIARVIQLL